MLYVIGFLLFAFVVTGIMFYLIEHSPSGWEDESGFHISPESAPQLTGSVNLYSPNPELVFGNIARYRALN